MRVGFLFFTLIFLRSVQGDCQVLLAQKYSGEICILKHINSDSLSCEGLGSYEELVGFQKSREGILVYHKSSGRELSVFKVALESEAFDNSPKANYFIQKTMRVNSNPIAYSYAISKLNSFTNGEVKEVIALELGEYKLAIVSCGDLICFKNDTFLWALEGDKPPMGLPCGNNLGYKLLDSSVGNNKVLVSFKMDGMMSPSSTSILEIDLTDGSRSLIRKGAQLKEAGYILDGKVIYINSQFGEYSKCEFSPIRLSKEKPLVFQKDLLSEFNKIMSVK